MLNIDIDPEIDFSPAQLATITAPLALVTAAIVASNADHTPEIVPAAPAQIRTATTIGEIDTSESTTARQSALEIAATSIGIDLPRTILPVGHYLYSSGVTALRAHRAKWSKLPAATEAIVTLQRAQAAQDRRDFTVNLSDVRATATARLFNAAKSPDGAGALGLTPHALKQLSSRIGISGGGSTLAQLDNDETAAIINRRTARAGASEKVFLRTIKVPGGRVIRGALSEKYAPVGDVDVANAIASLGARGQLPLHEIKLAVESDVDQTSFSLIWPAPIAIDTFRVGDLHRVVVTIDSNEVGAGALKINLALERALCANLTIGTARGMSLNLRHLGSAERLRNKLNEGIRGALSQAHVLIDSVRASAATGLGEKPVKEILAEIAESNGVTDKRAESWWNHYTTNYSDARTLWGVTSAITEAAQELPWYLARAEEEIASKIVARRAL